MRLFKKSYAVILSFILLFVSATSQAGISPGDLVIAGFNSAGDDKISLLATKNIPLGEIFSITDKGWYSTGGFYSSEGKLEWKGLRAIPAGTIIHIDMAGNYSDDFIKTGTFDLAVGGDQLFIYSGSDGAPNFIFGINYNGANWNTECNSTSTSTLPSTLISGQTEVSLVNRSSYVYGQYIDLSNLSNFFAELTNFNSWKGSTSAFNLASELQVGNTTILAPGDLLLIGFNAGGTVKEFAFVTFKALKPGTQIKITDRGWTNTGFYPNEGTIVYTTPSTGLVAGGIIQYKSNAVGNQFYQTGSFTLSASGDQLIAYQKGETSPNFLYGLNTLGNWSSTVGSNTSLAPAIGPVVGNSTVLQTTTGSQGNFYYTSITQGTKQDLQTSVSTFTASKYSYNGSSAVALPSYSNFLITDIITPLFSSNRNYVATWVANAPETDLVSLVGRPVADASVTVKYLDGLGRDLQTVSKEWSMATNSSPKDLVLTNFYDAFGREAINYLPYADITNDAAFKANVITTQTDFYNTQLNGQLGETTSNSSIPNWAYSKAVFEASPLNKEVETFAPGISWVGSANQTNPADRKSIKTKNFINSGNDAVRIWNTVNSSSPDVFGTYTSSGTYLAGELYKTITIDESNKQVIEFKDKNERIILRKIQIGNTGDDGTGIGHQGWMCTYYVYDHLGNLRCIIQPEAVERMSNPQNENWDLSPYLDGFCFRYEFDGYDRMIMKKLPGAHSTFMVYDNRDRLVMTQDGNMRSSANKKWVVKKYDALNRNVETGIWETNTSFITHLSSASSSSTYPVTNSDYETMTITHYDDYSGLPVELNSYLTTWNAYFASTNNNTWPYPQMPSQSNATKGLITWTSARILGTENFIHTANYYDENGRTIQTQNTNITNGLDVITTQYSWAGNPLVKVQYQKKSANNQQIHVIVSKISYDVLGRQTEIKRSVSSTINGVSVAKPEQSIVKMEYNALGQLKQRKLSPGFQNNAGLETLFYDYNIRGWLLGINRDYVRDANNDNYFGFDLGYDKINNNLIGGKLYDAPQFTGSITGTVWRSKGDGEKRRYDFQYDNANRLLKADFNQYTQSNFNKTAGIDFSVQMGDPNATIPLPAYDANGNIVKMQQSGLKVNSSSLIDDLTYSYQTNSNHLSNIYDNINVDNKLGDFKNGSNTVDDYAYDANGNLELDWNKYLVGSELNPSGQKGIFYNFLNLPDKIQKLGIGEISYKYDANGNKLQKVILDMGSNTTATYSYIAGFVYKDDVLVNIDQEEGRIRLKQSVGNTPASFVYDYLIKDHLGNVRAVLTEEVKQDIYPAVTMEDNLVITEQDYYTVDQTKRVLKSSITGMSSITDLYNHNLPHQVLGNAVINNNPVCGTGSLCTTDESNYLYQLNSNSNKTGMGITLKVMAGDRIDVLGKSYYFQNTGGTSGNSPLPIIDILNGFLSAPASIGNVHGVLGSDINVPSGLNGLNSMFTQHNNESNSSPNKPRSFINVIFFDEQFKSYEGGFRISMVGNNSEIKDHFSELQNIAAGKNGYVYIYCSNESPVNVFFDNIQVVHTRGPILEETHYYPYGLIMNGISSKAAGFLQNDLKYNGQQQQRGEFTDESGLEWVDYGGRTYDNQIGRWNQIDPMSENSHEGITPYNYCYGNPVIYADHEGKFGFLGAAIGGLIGGVASLTKSVIQNGFSTLSDSKTWKKAGVNALGGAIVGATGGLAAGAVATATTSFATSITEDVIDGNQIDYGKATFSSIVSTATFGLGKYGTDKLAKNVTKSWWNRGYTDPFGTYTKGNTNAFMRYLGKNPGTNVGIVVNRTADIFLIGTGIGGDQLFPAKPLYILGTLKQPFSPVIVGEPVKIPEFDPLDFLTD